MGREITKGEAYGVPALWTHWAKNLGDRVRLLGNRRDLRPDRRGRISARRGARDRRRHHLLRHGGSLWHGRVGRGAGAGARPRRHDVVIVTKFGVGYEEMPNRRDSSRARVLAS